MRIQLIACAAGAALLGGAEIAHAQRATERYIPVGQSPGVSGVRSYAGDIVSVDVQRRTFTVQTAEGRRTIRVTNRTRIWLDRSAVGQTNIGGAMADLAAGRKIEVAFADEARTSADWIKVVTPT